MTDEFNNLMQQMMMMKIYIALILTMFSFNFANALNIQQVTISSINSNDINVFVRVHEGFTFNYYNHSYTIDGNIITLTVCYYASGGSAITIRENNFLITDINLIQNNYQLVINVCFIQFDGNNIICSSQNPVLDTESLFFSTPLTEPVNLEITENDFFGKNLNFKNPSNGLFQFESKNEIPYLLIAFYDNTGRKVKHLKLSQGQVLDLRDLQNGIYYLNFKYEENQINKILILNKT